MAECIIRLRRALRGVGVMLSFGGHCHGSSWINVSFRVGLSESMCFMSLCVARQDDRHAQDTGGEGGLRGARAQLGFEGGTLERRWLNVPGIRRERGVEMGWCIKQKQEARLFLLWVAQIHLQWCLLRTLQFWETVASPSYPPHRSLPLSSPPPGRNHTTRVWAKIWMAWNYSFNNRWEFSQDG